MPVKRRAIDETTGDYIVESGRPTESDGILSSVLLALITTRGTCIAAPELGTRTNTIRKLTEQSEREAERFDAEALKHLVNSGDIRGLVVEARVELRSGVGYMGRKVSYTDRSGHRQAFRVSKEVG